MRRLLALPILCASTLALAEGGGASILDSKHNLSASGPGAKM